MSIQSFQLIPQGAVLDPAGNLMPAWREFFLRLSSMQESYSHQIPDDGFAISWPQGCTNLVLDPPAPLASGNIILPQSAADGQVVSIVTGQVVTALTVSAVNGQVVVNAPTTLTTAGCAFLFVAQTGEWYRSR